MFVLRLQAYICEAREMQHRPEAIVSIREIMAVGDCAGCRIETTENHVEAVREDI
jgi:hypothetical protein